MTNVFKLSYVGNPEGLLEYLELESFNCKDCQDTGVILKDEWVNTDDSYEVAVRCECNN